MEPCALLDLPRPFLRQLVSDCDFDAVFALACTSKNALQAVLDLRPGTLAVWNTPKPNKLQQLLPLGGVQALLLLDSHMDEPFSHEELQGLSGLRSAALSYRLPNLVHSLLASPHTCHLNSIIVCGRKPDLRFLPALSKFLDQLQGFTSLQHLALTLPCGFPADCALGQLTQLLSLRLATCVTADMAPVVTHHTKCWWEGPSWLQAVTPLQQLTSLQVQQELMLSRKDDLQLEALSKLQRLEVQFDLPLPLGIHTQQGPFHNSLTARSAACFLRQPGFTCLSQLTRLALKAQYASTSYFADLESAEEWNMPPSTMCIIAQLTNLCALQLSLDQWSCTFQQLQPLSACSKLSELVLNELALGFADSCSLIDAGGTQLNSDEQRIATAALQAADHLWSESVGRCECVSAHRHDAAPAGARLSRPGNCCCSSRLRAAGPAGSERMLAHVEPPGSTSQHSAAVHCGRKAAGSYPTTVKIRSQALQVPLLPALQVLSVTSLWWRLPLCVLSGALTDVSYKRLTHLEAGGGYVMGDLQAIEAAADVVQPAIVQAWLPGMAPGFAADEVHPQAPLPDEVLQELPGAGALAEAQPPTGWDGAHEAGLQTAVDEQGHLVEAAVNESAAAVQPLEQQQEQQFQYLWDHQQLQEPLMPADGAGVMLQWAPAAAPSTAATTAMGEGSQPSFQVAPLALLYGDVIRGLPFLEKLDVDVTALGKIIRLTSTPLQQVRELRLHMMGDVQLPPGGLPCMPRLTYLEFYLPERRSWGVSYNEDEDLSLWLHQRHVQKLVVHGTYHAGGFFAPGHLARARSSMPNLKQLIFRHCQDLEAHHLRHVVCSGLCSRIDVVEGHNFEEPGEPLPPEPVQESCKSAGFWRALAASNVPPGAGAVPGTLVEAGRGGVNSSTWQLNPAQPSNHTLDNNSPGANVSGPDVAEDEPAGPDVAEDELAGPDVAEDELAQLDAVGDELAAQSEPGVPLAGGEPSVNAFFDSEGGSGDQATARAGTGKAGQTRCKELQAVIAEAAAVGVMVKLLPAVDWHDWNRDLLTRG